MRKKNDNKVVQGIQGENKLKSKEARERRKVFVSIIVIMFLVLQMLTGLFFEVRIVEASPYTGHLMHLRGQNYTYHTFTVVGTTSGSLWGCNLVSPYYTDDSTLEKAAVHSGFVEVGETKEVTVEILPGGSGYVSSNRFGITSSSWGSWGGSYRIIGSLPLHTVSFEDYDGTVLKTETVEHGSSSATAPADPTREGYTFTGWDKAFDNVTADLTVTAQYDINQYVITFNSSGGSEVPVQTLDYDSLVPEPAAPTKDNHDFAGWFKEAELTNPWDFAEDRVPAEDITLYARWTLNTYTVTLNPLGGTVDPTEATFSHDGNYSALPTPTRAGYNFEGWFTAAVGGDEKQAGDTIAQNDDHSLYARWTANTYTVTFDKQEGSGGSDSVTTTYDDSMPAAGAPTRTGYTFGGYYAETGGVGTQYYTADMTSANDWDQAGDATIYAQWTLNTYTVAYAANEATGGNVPTDSSGYAEGAAVTVPGNTGDLERTGYTFAGWNTEPDGSGDTYAAGDSFTMGSSNVTLYAEWEQDQSITDEISEDEVAIPKHTLTVVVEGKGSVSPGVGKHSYTRGTVVDLEAVPAEGWVFIKWIGPVRDGEKPSTTVTIDKNIKITALFERKFSEGEPEPPLVIILTVGSNIALVNDVVFLMDVAPFINLEASRTLIPVRYVSEYLGAEVHWLPETRQVRIVHGNTEIVLTISSNIALVNGEEGLLDCAAKLLDSRAFVPLRFVSEMLGAVVHWDGEKKTITITR